MKIFLISQYFFPENSAGAFRWSNFATKLNENYGIDIHVCCPYPNFPLGKLYDGYEAKLFGKELYRDIIVYRNYIRISKNTHLINRILMSLSFLFFGILNMIISYRNNPIFQRNYDFIVATSGPIFSGVFGYIVSILSRTPFIFEIRDILHLQMQASKMIKNVFAFKLTKFVEIYLCKKATKIVVVTNGFKKVLINNTTAQDLKPRFFLFFVGFPSDIVPDLVISDYSYCSFFVKRFHWKYCFQKQANLRQC